jgi:hypothetical protein
MFKNLLTTDFFQVVSDEAQKGIIKEDRDKYKEIFDETRSIIVNDPIIILSNPNKIINGYLSKSKQSTPLEETMIIYTTHTRRTTTLIANHLHKKVGKLVQMRSIIPNDEYEIMYNMRGLIKIYYIERYKNIDISELLNAVKIDNLYYFPPEIELMDIYHKLYLPNYYDDWDTLLQQEKLLYNIVSDSISKPMKKEGGLIKNCPTCKDNRNLDIDNIKQLMLKFLDNENYVLIGEFANKLINTPTSNQDTSDNIKSNIQIISENGIEQDYQNIINYLSSYTNYGIYYKKKKLYIPKDNRIYKYTLFIKYPSLTSVTEKGSRGIDKQFLDIYNCGEFELIPYIQKKHNNISLRIGIAFVQMRFLLIDMWVYRVLKYLKSIDDKMFQEKCLCIISNMKTIKKLIPINLKKKAEYMGINYDEKIAQKILISKKNIKKSSYYPELSMKKDKNYKLIATSS